MKKYVDVLSKNKKIFIILLVVINITAVFGLFRIKLNTDFDIFSTKGSKYESLMIDTNESFGELSQIMIILEKDGLTKDDLNDVREFQEFLNNVPNVESIQGVAPQMIVISGNPVTFDDITIDQFELYHSTLGEFSPYKVIENTRYYQYTVIINDEFTSDNLKSIENHVDGLNFDNYIAGDFYNSTKIVEYITFILMLLPPLALMLILFVFKLQIGSIKATLLSIIPAGIGALWTMGLIGYIGREVSILSAVVPIFVIVIGSADGLHFMSHIQDSRKEGLTNKDSISHTLKMVGVPMIVTTLTSMVGFLALLSMNTASIVDLAVYASVGIFFAGVATWYVLPLILVGNIDVIGKVKPIRKNNPSMLIKKLIGVPSIIAVIMIITLSAIFYSRISNEFNMLMIYKDYTVVNKNAEKIEEISGGSIPIYIVAEFDDGILTLDSKNKVDALSETLVESGFVNKIVNPYDFINLMYTSSTGNTNIPNDMALANVYSIASANPDAPVGNLLNVEDGKVRLLIFSKNLENDTLLAIENIVNNDGNNVYVTGVQYMMMDLNRSIQTMQFNSIVLALGVVLIMLFATIKSIRISLISLVPIIITIISVYGFLGITRIPLNVTTTIIFSITIGVGIDYAVHFSSVYKIYLKEEKDNINAIKKAFKYTSRPVIANALGISIGLSILMASPLRIHFNVSVLMWVSMIISVIMTLTILPLLFSKGKYKELW